MSAPTCCEDISSNWFMQTVADSDESGAPVGNFCSPKGMAVVEVHIRHHISQLVHSWHCGVVVDVSRICTFNQHNSGSSPVAKSEEAETAVHLSRHDNNSFWATRPCEMGWRLKGRSERRGRNSPSSSLSPRAIALSMARLTNDAGETSLPIPPSDTDNDANYESRGFGTRCVQPSRRDDTNELRKRGQSISKLLCLKEAAQPHFRNFIVLSRGTRETHLLRSSL
ncbi:unnamed protein product [Protopolystoma xenopodis]|uniref:Uncharacterized protein n=1 Tax=Protopolystoma xenopodis TaxID=117903 RepID=A0A448WGK4_9PLAT|nr:unnamed protein product [Protopolystoma xenopodis]